MRIIQMFNWDLTQVKENLNLVKEQNFDAVQINPIQPLKEDSKDLWWLSYQPCAFKIGNQYGTCDSLKELCNEANKYNINIFADTVFNHMAGSNDGSLTPHEKVDPAIKYNPYFWKEKRNINNWDNRSEVVNLCMGLPGLNLMNWDLQNIIIKFLNELIDCGVSGFRFDAAKCIGLPSEGIDFWPRLIYSLSKYGMFLYGEVIFTRGDVIKEYSNYFKILTNENLNNISRDSTIKFIESHDTYYEFKYTKDISSYNINEYYKGLASYYPNTLYFVRPFDDAWKDIKVRDANRQKVYK